MEVRRSSVNKDYLLDVICGGKKRERERRNRMAVKKLLPRDGRVNVWSLVGNVSCPNLSNERKTAKGSSMIGRVNFRDLQSI